MDLTLAQNMLAEAERKLEESDEIFHQNPLSEKAHMTAAHLRQTAIASAVIAQAKFFAAIVEEMGKELTPTE